jgi:hypothetical protein
MSLARSQSEHSRSKLSITLLDRLDQTILAKAFRGELVGNGQEIVGVALAQSP